MHVKGTQAGTEALETVSGTLTVDPISAVVLVKGESAKPAGAKTPVLPILGGILVFLKRRNKL